LLEIDIVLQTLLDVRGAGGDRGSSD